MKLRRNEFCPVHRSISCCGRESTSKPRQLRVGIQRIEDPHHPRGYRELRSRAEMRKLLNRKIVEQDRKCAICETLTLSPNDFIGDAGSEQIRVVDSTGKQVFLGTLYFGKTQPKK